MVEQGYYSNRIKELEKRKIQVTGQLVTARLTLKGIDKEIKKCEDGMQNMSNTLSQRLDERNKTIESLQKKLSEKNKQLKQVMVENKKLLKQINTNNVEINDLKTAINFKPNISCSKDNIFKQLKGGEINE